MEKAFEQSPAAVKKWLEEEYPVIAASAKVEGVEIHRCDETGLRSDDVRGRSYAPQGQTVIVRRPPSLTVHSLAFSRALISSTSTARGSKGRPIHSLRSACSE
jgi:hypothetical protein